jgi:hypothetical protein
MSSLSDTAWVSIALIAFIITSGIIVIVLLMRDRPESSLSISTKWGSFSFSPGDAKKMVQEWYGNLSSDILNALSHFNSSEGKPGKEILDKLNDNLLDTLVKLKLVQDPNGDEDNYQKEALKLAYCGWQVLESFTHYQPKSEPWRWPKG